MGSAFRVVVTRDSESFVHRATLNNTSANVAFIDYPFTNGKPEAVVSVTQICNPGGGVGVYNDYPAAVRFNAGRERWTVFKEDFAPI